MSSIVNTLRDIASESALNKAEKFSLRQIAKSYKRLEAEKRALKRGLRKYGDHLGTCYLNLRMGECNCGFAEALKAK